MRTSSRRVPSYAAPMAESTVIGEANEATGALGPARLVVVNGAVAGSAVALGDDETTIGRARANDVVLPDISVSRRHAVLRRVANGYVVVDRASGNGTRINGRSVRVARLQDGDEIALGDSVVQFVEAGGLVVRSSVAVRGGIGACGARSSRGRIAAAIGVPLLAVAVLGSWGGKHWVGRRSADARSTAHRPPLAEAPPEKVASAAEAAVAADHHSPAAPVPSAPADARERDRAALSPLPVVPPTASRADVAGPARLEVHRATARRRTGSDPATHNATHGWASVASRSRPSVGGSPEPAGREQWQSVAAEASDAYLRGYVAKDIDEEAAREAFRSVVELLPANDATALKARRWLERLDGKRGEED